MELRTEKQRLYFEEVIRLHCEYGCGEDRISRIIPAEHSAVSGWIAVFAAENAGKTGPMKRKNPEHPTGSAAGGAIRGNDVKALQAEAVRLQSQLKHGQLRADA
jgi:hypothetical protein